MIFPGGTIQTEKSGTNQNVNPKPRYNVASFEPLHWHKMNRYHSFIVAQFKPKRMALTNRFHWHKLFRDIQQVRKDFTWGSGPLIKFRDMTPAGMTVSSNLIEIAENLVKESKHSRKYLLYVILTILHEDVHALSIETGKWLDEDFYDKYGEEGYAFEIEAFGRLTSLSDGTFTKVLKELDVPDDRPTESEEDRKKITDFFNNFTNLEEGRYKWNGKQFIKID